MNIPFQVVRSSRKTIAIQVKRDGTVIVRAPHRCSLELIDLFMQEKQEWVRKKLVLCSQKEAGKEMRRVQGGIMHMPETEAACLIYRKQAKQVFARKVAWYAQQIQVSFGTITIREQKTRLGSCSSRGNLNFNWRLLLAPEPVLDYVVVHELAHRKEMNHSSRFWGIVEEIMPDYRQYREWLKQYGDCLYS